MSRSYKHTPRAGEKKDKEMKRIANRKFRRQRNYNETLHHKQYRKNFCCYDICDYEEIGTSFEEYWKFLVSQWYRWRQYYGMSFPDKEEAKKDYFKYFIRK